MFQAGQGETGGGVEGRRGGGVRGEGWRGGGVEGVECGGGGGGGGEGKGFGSVPPNKHGSVRYRYGSVRYCRKVLLKRP